MGLGLCLFVNIYLEHVWDEDRGQAQFGKDVKGFSQNKKIQFGWDFLFKIQTAGKNSNVVSNHLNQTTESDSNKTSSLL